jgi:sulfoxide reductase heme-binding subunit YedZ
MNDRLLWYTTRGSGIVALIMLTGVVVLGILAQSRAETRWWPRFLTPAFHRSLALSGGLFLLLHIITAIIDPASPAGWLIAVVPFATPYRALWMGLGTISFELFTAILLTSLLRARVGAVAWRAIHFLSYPVWVLAVLHTVGAGSDTLARWMLATTVICVLVVSIATAVRLTPLRRARMGGERLVAEFRGGLR